MMWFAAARCVQIIYFCEHAGSRAFIVCAKCVQIIPFREHAILLPCAPAYPSVPPPQDAPRPPHDAPRPPQDRLKPAPRPPQNCPRPPQDRHMTPETAPMTLKDRFKTPQDRPMTPQDCPKMLQTGHFCVHDEVRGPKTASRRLKMARPPHDAPRPPQDRLKPYLKGNELLQQNGILIFVRVVAHIRT